MFGIVRLIGGVVLLLAVGALAFMSYQAGFAGGVAQAGAGAIPGDAYIPAGGFRFFFAVLAAVFFLFVTFGLLRVVMFSGMRGRFGHHHGMHGRFGRHGYWGDHQHGDGERSGFGRWEQRAREIHDEWHRAASKPEAGDEAAGDQPATS